ncbi:hypothetical protein B484DRAFT_400510 [Ochromonadaceae sp. CCMP2298]|nr:hypothetical protein B484DRAFT_400510 [Ochromonadaceae sp. CCMP2298]|mmetsp:Transcript_3973/g.8952  ORF Transcript_3973/g.8952 Transcript_3973/m.8952 type:complete len:274 (+) Transcript_3973:39-860(+)
MQSLALALVVVCLSAQIGSSFRNRIPVPGIQKSAWSRCASVELGGGFQSTATATAVKTWTLRTCLRDHRTILSKLPQILGAYVGPNSIEPKTNEAVMLAVNALNDCPYCTGLHGELARMAANPLGQSSSTEGEAILKFAKTFSKNDGRGASVEAGLSTLKEAAGGRATSVAALCWFLHWGSFGGNTINAIRGKLMGLLSQSRTPGTGTLSLFDIPFFLYYGPLFLIIGLLNKALTVMPEVPPVVSSSIGVALALVGGAWMVLPAALGCLFYRD